MFAHLLTSHNFLPLVWAPSQQLRRCRCWCCLLQVTFDLKAYNAMLASLEPEVAEMRARQRTTMAKQLELEEESLALLAKEGGDKASGGALGMDDDEDESAYDKPGMVKVAAPFTANVWEVRVEVGQEVSAGQTLMVLEAMKMESPVTAPAAGRVVAVRAKLSQLIGAGSTLVVIESA